MGAPWHPARIAHRARKRSSLTVSCTFAESEKFTLSFETHGMKYPLGERVRNGSLPRPLPKNRVLGPNHSFNRHILPRCLCQYLFTPLSVRQTCTLKLLAQLPRIGAARRGRSEHRRFGATTGSSSVATMMEFFNLQKAIVPNIAR